MFDVCILYLGKFDILKFEKKILLFYMLNMIFKFDSNLFFCIGNDSFKYGSSCYVFDFNSG